MGFYYNCIEDTKKRRGKPIYTHEFEVICRICGDRASGCHYGVHCCEGCKGFFRRCLKKPLGKKCNNDNQCKLDMKSRRACPSCRYTRCVNAGMSQDAVKFGRMPKKEREKLAADKDEFSNLTHQRIVELHALTGSIHIAFKCLFPDCNIDKGSSERGNAGIHYQTNEMTSQKDVSMCYQEMIVPLMLSSIKFAKKIPGFKCLTINDQVSLMKQGALAVAVTMMYDFVDSDSVTLQSHNEKIVIQRSEVSSCKEVSLLLRHHLQIADRLQKLQLQTSEIALFCAVVLMSETPATVANTRVESIQSDLLHALQIDIYHNHPKNRKIFPWLLLLISDLRQIVDEFRSYLHSKVSGKSDNFKNTPPLIRDIFDLPM